MAAAPSHAQATLPPAPTNLKRPPNIMPSSVTTTTTMATFLNTATRATLQTTVDLKQGLLDAVRHSLQVLDYASFPIGETLKENQVIITANLAQKTNEEKAQL
jgi:hypothetical protein